MQQAGGRSGETYHQALHADPDLADISVSGGIAYVCRRGFLLLFRIRPVRVLGLRQGGHRGSHLEAVGAEGHGVGPHLGQAAGREGVAEE